MDDTTIERIADSVARKVIPVLLKGEKSDELTIADIKKQYPKASPYLVRKWCKTDLLPHWFQGDSENSRYIFKREDFEKIYYQKFGRK